MGETSLSADAPRAALVYLTEQQVRIGKGPSKKRFEQIFRDGKRAAGALCRICSLPGAGLIGVATSRKIGNRPTRNRARRRFQEALRETAICSEPKLDWVVIVGVAGSKASTVEIKDETAKLVAELRSRWAERSEFF